jgi:hypothetical protein
LVKTHCCFCGQQCGIQLKVRNNEVIGFEPWEFTADGWSQWSRRSRWRCVFWATATWWIPMLVILGVWRHVYRRFPLRYEPLYWGAVFPLGMYTACTIRLSQLLDDSAFLMFIPRVFIYVAYLAWGLTFLGLMYQLGQRTTRPGRIA